MIESATIAPIEIGGLKTADPLAPEVRAWWTAKVKEIYKVIPDFGGFLVKANSEGQPGPQDYKRTHADGANMLAAALEPHGGLVMWRAFVYSESVKEDRHKQAYTEFQPLDGTFRPNVLVQVKNGALDFIEKPFDATTVVTRVRVAVVAWSRRASQADGGGLPQIFPGQDLLTSRERDVLGQIAAGSSNKQAGRELGISPRTIEVHRARIMEKLGAKNAADLVRIVLSEGRRA